MNDLQNQLKKEKEELIVLVENNVSGGSVNGDYINPSVIFLASVNPKTGEVKKEKGRLDWYIKNTPNRKGWGFDLKGMEIYHVKVNKYVEKELLPYQTKIMNNRYLLLKILKKGVKNKELEAIKDSYLKPVVINNEIGEFTLKRRFSWYEGKINWLNNECTILLNTDEDDEVTANIALNTLNTLYSNQQHWDKIIKEFAAKELIFACNDWAKDEDINAKEITKEEFINRIVINKLTIEL